LAVSVTGSSAASPRTSALGREAAAAALTQVGTPYVWGHASPSTGFDASGLVVWAYANAGHLSLPHFAPALWRLGRHVTRRQLEVGDVVFFSGRSHVGIYVGNGRFIHAPHTGSTVRVQKLSVGWYGKNYVGAVRFTR
jgi:cell wall-associated NlpC family hydrolase